MATLATVRQHLPKAERRHAMSEKAPVPRCSSWQERCSLVTGTSRPQPIHLARNRQLSRHYRSGRERYLPQRQWQSRNEKPPRASSCMIVTPRFIDTSVSGEPLPHPRQEARSLCVSAIAGTLPSSTLLASHFVTKSAQARAAPTACVFSLHNKPAVSMIFSI